jgi:hypothetical protein
MNGWTAWATALDTLYHTYRRPASLYSMTTENELCFVETYARYWFSGAGKIVDLGCWLGATTFCLARGLTQNSWAIHNRMIEAIDRFVWEEWMNPYCHMYRPGDDFYGHARDLLQPYESVVRLYKQDLLEYEPSNEPIEFLFVDAMKSWELADKIVRSFFPLLIEGISYVVQQDFAHHDPIVATNHLIMWYLRDHFQCVYHVPRSCSVVYFHTKRVEVANLPILTKAFFTLDMIHETWDYSLQCVSPDMWPPLLVCKLCFLIETGFDDAAHKQAEDFAVKEVSLPDHLITDVVAIVRQKINTAKTNGQPYDLLSDIESLLLARSASRTPL